MQKIYYILLLVLSFHSINAQTDSVLLYFGDTIYTDPGRKFSVTLRIHTGAPIATISSTLKFDTAQINLLDCTGNIPGMVINPIGDRINVVWAASNGIGQTLPDSNALLQIQFKARNQVPITTRIEWSNLPLPTEIYQFDGANLLALSVATIPQVICIRTCDIQLDLGGSKTFCTGDSVQITAECSNCTDFYWNNGQKTTSCWFDVPGWQIAFAVGAKACFTIDSVQVLESSPPLVSLLDTVFVCKGEIVTIEPFLLSTDVDLLWSNGENTPAIKVGAGGEYSVIAVNASGCHAFDTTKVFEKACRQTKPYIPNVFSPGSSENAFFQVFFPDIALIANFQLHVYDRWGSIVFSSKDPLSKWDGGVHGNLPKVGVYVYSLEVTYWDGEIERVTGDVLVE